jgi:predicted aspartyl protease
MGHVRIRVEIVNPVHRGNSIVVQDALVDTGATRTTIPRAMANKLELEIVGSQQIRTADGSANIDQSFALLRYDDKQTFGDIWISDRYPGVLIRVITLEALGLAVDPGSGRLTASDFLLL